jgi:hypothetical protein
MKACIGELWLKKMNNPVRIKLIALLMTLATQAGADTKKYGKKECNDISAVIDFVRSKSFTHAIYLRLQLF